MIRAWPIFGLPRIMTGKDSVTRLLDAVDKPYNGITLCTGSFGSNQNNDICEIIKACRGRIPFAHVRNLKYNSPRVLKNGCTFIIRWLNGYV